MRISILVPILLLALPGLARAEVVEVQPGGFTVKHEAAIELDAETVWQIMIYRIDDWWDPSHSWSGDASNLYIDARIGGCFCERLPASGGAVEHLRITYIEPGHAVRMTGALGPLADMAVGGRMIWRIEPAEPGSSTLTFTYHVHGFMAGGFESLAPVVDSVIGQQHQRLVELAAPTE